MNKNRLVYLTSVIFAFSIGMFLGCIFLGTDATRVSDVEDDTRIKFSAANKTATDLISTSIDEKTFTQLLNGGLTEPTLFWIRPAFSLNWKHDEPLMNIPDVISLIEKSKIPLVAVDYSNPSDESIAKHLKIAAENPFGSTLILIDQDGKIDVLIDNEKKMISFGDEFTSGKGVRSQIGNLGN